MKPDSIYKCVDAFSGYSEKGEPFNLREGHQYFKTIHDSRVILHDYDNPDRGQSPWLASDEFAKLAGKHLSKVADV